MWDECGWTFFGNAVTSFGVAAVMGWFLYWHQMRKFKREVKADRVYYLDLGDLEPPFRHVGYYTSWNGSAFGPFPTELQAKQMLLKLYDLNVIQMTRR